jgi:hypothetical protein
MATALPRNPTDPKRYTRYNGKHEFESFYLSDWKGLTKEQLKIMKDVWPHLVDENSCLTVESLPDGRRKLTFDNPNVKIICDPRDELTQRRAQEQLIREAAKPLELTRSPLRNLVARVSMRLRHHGYM